MARRQRAEIGPPPPRLPPVCPLCDRLIPHGAKASRHHLTPKLKGGAKLGTVLLHQICHSTIHANFSESDLARRLNDVASLRAEPKLAEFLAWIAGKPADFHASTRTTKTRADAHRSANHRHR